MTRLLVLPGDGIGPAVTDAALAALDAIAPDVEVVRAPVGRAVLAEHGHPLGSQARQRLAEGVDGVLFGATETRPGEPSAVLALREETGARLSIRPPGPLVEEGPTVYRELTEGLYAGDGHGDEEQAEDRRTITREATAAFAELALDRIGPETTPTVAHKATVLDASDGLFLATVQDAARARGRAVDERLVDALAHDVARQPQAHRAILAPNLYGDVLSDLLAGLHGGLGVAPSLTLGEGPPIAEPVHGTAPDLAGTGQANPTAAIASLALLLAELDHETEARALQGALQRALADPEARTPDLGGQATTQQVTDRVVAALEEVTA